MAGYFERMPNETHLWPSLFNVMVDANILKRVDFHFRTRVLGQFKAHSLLTFQITRDFEFNLFQLCRIQYLIYFIQESGSFPYFQ